MIFTTDLDRTLIYSARVLSNYPSNVEATIVEAVDGRSISFTSTAFFNWLNNRKKDGKLKIVANTARSIKEFNRISIHENFDYAIVANGGIILKDGIPMVEWENRINRSVINKLLSLIIKDLDNMDCINYNSRIIDSSYILTKTTNDRECAHELEQVIQRYKDISFMIQRGKVYIIPSVISKANAIKWISGYLGEDIKIAAGDSKTDLEMLKLAEISIVPSHADIIEQELMIPSITISSGLSASIDILSILEHIEKEE